VSKYAELATTITDAQALVAALGELYQGATVEIHTEPTTCRGYAGETLQAHIIVRNRGRYGTDIGFLRDPNGTYRAVVDDHNSDGQAQKLVGKITQHYAVARTLQQAARKGFKLQSRETTADGQVRLVFQGRS
jgi:uncharacterized protein DUF1257